MRTRAALLGLILTLNSGAYAVPHAPRAPDAPPPGSALFEELNLSEEQQGALEAAFQRHAEDQRLLQESLEAELQSILTPEQYAQWQDSRPRPPRPPWPPRPEPDS